MSRKTMNQKLYSREVREPNGLLYRALMIIARIQNRGLGTRFTFNARPGEDGGPFVLISNHASRNDYLFTAPAALPRKLNYAVGYNEFMRFPIGLLLRMMQVIPKKNFTPDLYTVKEIYKVIRAGGAICINGKPVFHVSQLPLLAERLRILIGIITVPAENAQEVADLMVRSGIKAIWNFAPTHIKTPDDVLVRYENLAASLAALSQQLQLHLIEEGSTLFE